PEPVGPGREAALPGGAGEAEVPGADLLAGVAAEEPVALQAVRYRAPVLDGLVGEAADRVDHVGPREGVGGAGALAGGAGAAEVAVGPVVRIAGPVEDQRSQQHPRAVGAGDEQA